MCCQMFTSICPLKKKSAPLLRKGAVKCTYLAAWQIQRRMLTEINESSLIPKKLSVKSNTVKQLKAFGIISSEIPISPLALC